MTREEAFGAIIAACSCKRKYNTILGGNKMPKQTIILTDNEVTVVLRALAICQSDMEEAYDEAKNSMVKDYYKRKAEKYSRVWNSVWNSVYTCGNKDDALWDLDKAIMIATDAIGRP